MIQFTSFQLLEALGCPEKMGIIRHSKKEVTKALARTEKKEITPGHCIQPTQALTMRELQLILLDSITTLLQ